MEGLMPTRQEMSDADNDRLRAAVRRLLAKHGSQGKLAPLLGVHQTALSKFLLGQIGVSVDFARNIAKLEGVHLVSLLGPEAADIPGAVDLELIYLQLNELGRQVTAMVEVLGPTMAAANPALRDRLAKLAFTIIQTYASLADRAAIPDGKRAQLAELAVEAKQLIDESHQLRGPAGKPLRKR
jgi:transcriptional regulator with XRE-family HTH domain